MSVVINEFEVVMEPPSRPPAQAPLTQQQPEVPPPRPEDVIRIQQRQQARMKRVWAD
jgi:hypothetical protein